MILRFCTPNTCYWGTVKDRIIAQKKGKVNAISEWCWAQQNLFKSIRAKEKKTNISTKEVRAQ